MTQVWRLIVHGPVDGALNMAIDRAVQLGREEGSSPPTLRFYRWARPTLTLGRFQDTDSADLAACSRAGIDVVRRFTGGRGVIHDDELTYSVVAGLSDGVPRGVAASYRHFSAALAATYHALGVEASITARDRGSSASGACYLLTTRADLSHDGRKLSGSAQVWLGKTVLQHGSFLRSRDVDREAWVFGLDDAQKAALANGVITLADALPETPTLEQVGERASFAFEEALGIRLVEGELHAREAQVAASLVDSVQVRRPDPPSPSR